MGKHIGRKTEKLEQYLVILDNSIHIPVEFRFLDAKEYELYSKETAVGRFQ